MKCSNVARTCSLFLAAFVIASTAWSQDDAADSPQTAQQQQVALRDLYHQELKSPKGPDVQKLQDIGQQLKQLFAETADVQVAIEARMDAYAIDVALGRLLVRKSQLEFEADDKASTLEQARTYFATAATLCDSTADVIELQLAKSKTAAENDDLTDGHKILQKTLLQARLTRAAIEEESADAYPDDDDAKQQTLQRAKARFEEFYKQYRTMLVGVYARMYQGRIALKMKEFDECTEIFESLLRLPSNPIAFEVVKLKASVLLADCRLLQEDADLNAEATRLRKHLRSLPQSLQQSSEAGQLRARLKTIKGRTSSDGDAAASDGELDIIDIAATDDVELTPHEKATIADYRLAHAHVREKMAKYQTARELANTLELKLQATDSDEAREQAKVAVEEAKQAAARLLPAAITACGKMLELGDATSSQRPTSVALYYLSYLYMMTNDYTTALLYGEDLARNQPLAYGARNAAKISAACYLKQVEQALAPAEKSQLLRQYIAMETYTVKTWPTSKEAAEALKRLRSFREAARAAQQR